MVMLWWESCRARGTSGKELEVKIWEEGRRTGDGDRIGWIRASGESKLSEREGTQTEFRHQAREAALSRQQSRICNRITYQPSSVRRLV